MAPWVRVGCVAGWAVFLCALRSLPVYFCFSIFSLLIYICSSMGLIRNHEAQTKNRLQRWVGSRGPFFLHEVLLGPIGLNTFLAGASVLGEPDHNFRQLWNLFGDEKSHQMNAFRLVICKFGVLCLVFYTIYY